MSLPSVLWPLVLLISFTLSNPCLPGSDCLLGPPDDEDVEKNNDPYHMTSGHPPSVHPFSHNAFHVWDQDDIMIPLSHSESPQTSPLLLAAIPYIPSFFPLAHSPTSHSSLAFPGSPGPGTRDPSILRDLWWHVLDTLIWPHTHTHTHAQAVFPVLHFTPVSKQTPREGQTKDRDAHGRVWSTVLSLSHHTDLVPGMKSSVYYVSEFLSKTGRGDQTPAEVTTVNKAASRLESDQLVVSEVFQDTEGSA